MYKYQTNETKVINQLNSTNLTRFRIYGLFGRYDVELPFDREVNIYIGENGLGKTTILNCLYYVLDKNFQSLSDMQFEWLEIELKNGETYSISQSDIFAYTQMRPGRHIPNDDFLDWFLSEFNISKEDLYNLDDATINMLIQRFASTQEISFSMAKNRLYRYLEIYQNAQSKGWRNGDVKKVKSFIAALNKNIGERIIYLPTYRRIENDFRNLRLRNDDINSPEMLIRFGMSDVQTSIENILTKIRDLAMQGYNEMTGILLKQYTYAGNSISPRKKQINEDIVKIVLDRLGTQVEDTVKEKIMQTVKSGQIYAVANAHLFNLLTKLVANYDLQRVYDNRINNFVNTCNKYFIDKYFYYNPSNLTLEIYMNNNQKNTVKLTQLSSGEKQIVSLFSRLYLESEAKSIVIIDEPELSLSINWQQMLLPDIMRTQNCNLLLTVTHSPFIFENEFDMDAREIRAYMTAR